MTAQPGRPIEWITDRRGRWIPRAWWPESRAAPGHLEELRQFVNTVNLHSGADLLGSVAEAKAWLRESGHAPGSMTSTDVGELTELRSILRCLAIANGGSGDGAAQWHDLQQIAARHPVTAVFGVDSMFRPVSQRGVDAFITAILGIVARARIDGTWTMLKACPEQSCHWLIYDRTKNHSATWCSSGGCGGRVRARNYRSRHSSSTAPLAL